MQLQVDSTCQALELNAGVGITVSSVYQESNSLMHTLESPVLYKLI
jgi:hypothetical protein